MARERRAFFRWGFIAGERRRSNRIGALLLVLSIPAFLLCERYAVRAGRVTDISMLPTLKPGGYFLINKYAYRFWPPERGDVVVFKAAGNQRWHYVKRVVGLPGETIEISDGRVIVNGRPLEEPYAAGPAFPDRGAQVIPEETYFVMGDNRANSEDSRHVGPVPLARIEGKIKPGKIFAFR